MFSNTLRKFSVVAAAVLLLSPFAAFATGGSSAEAPHVHVQLVAPTNLVAGQAAQAGVYFKLEPGWHVYWKNAGDSGEPPNVRWTLPAGITADALEFPTPKRLPLGPLMDFGYEDEVLFPVTLHATASAAAGAAILHAKVDWLVCREVCIPGKAELEVGRKILAAGSGFALVDAGDSGLLQRLASTLPSPLPSGDKAVFAPTATGFRLAVLTGQREATAVFFPAEESVLDNPSPQTVTVVGSGSAQGVVLDLKKDPNMPAAPAQLAGVVELSGGRAYEIAAVPGTIPAAAASSFDAAAILKAAGLAFLGGVILNLMPCVFPVLFLKGLALVHASGEEHGLMVRKGLVYTAGIVASFWLLVGLLLGLRAAGSTLGWGFQFQSPVFIALIAGLLFFLGLSLAGQFEIGLTLTSAGGALVTEKNGVAKQGYAGSFFTGVLAVVVATPCTAPFMGAAVGYALAQSPLVTFAIFTALALGLAAPYLLLTIQPAWTRILPKPGAWMEVLKQATAVPIFATVIWLVWVLAQTRGAEAVAALLATFLLLAIAGWILGRWPARRVPGFAAALVVIAAVAASVYGVNVLAAPVASASSYSDEPSTAGSSNWEPWSQAAVDKYLAEGRPVLVDFTASWCLSCQVNERLALRTSEVNAALRKDNVAMLKADWTQHDDAISQVLTSFGRSGVPVYALYAANTAGKGAPTLLPEVLTPGIVIDALNKLPQAESVSR